jgi:hypothetical protein
MIVVPLLEVSWKKEWPNHLISTNPRPAAGTKEGAPSCTIFGFRQAAFAWLGRVKRQDRINIARINTFLLISIP